MKAPLRVPTSSRTWLVSSRLLEVAGGEELLVGLAAHLRAHLVEAVAGDRADLEQVIDIGARFDQALEVALADERLLRLREREPVEKGLFVALEGGAVLRLAKRRAQLVQPIPAPRGAQIEDR